QRGGRRPVTSALLPMALPALQFGEEFLPVLDAVHSQRRLRRHFDGLTGLLIFPARRKSFDEGHQVGALLVRQSDPGRHVGSVETAGDGVEKIVIGWQSAGRRRTAFECGRHKVAGQNVKVRTVLAVAISAKTVAAPAIAEIDRKSTRLNSSHSQISYAVFCLKKK